MRKMFSVTLAMVLSLSLVGCGGDAANKDSEQASSESSVTEEVAESESTTEELTEAEIEAAAIAEELGLDEELSAMLLEEIQWVYDAYTGDEEEMREAVIESMKEEFAYMAEKKANPEPEPEVEKPDIEINWNEENLPEDRAWIDNLYNKLIEKDYQAVIDILYSDDIMANAEPYAYVEYTYNAIGYKLVTSDGKYVGLILSYDGTTTDAWYSEAEDRDYGFMYTKKGDIVVSAWIDTTTGNKGYRWFDGTTIRDSYGSEITLEEDEAYAVWAM